MTIFGVPWNDLRFEHVEQFLADAGTEPLLWEAKGVSANKGQVRKQVCGFANSHDGGYLIIGADESRGVWGLNGVEFPDEPPLWISSVVGDQGVTPYPDGLDTKAWPRGDGRQVAVVWIPPTPTPPCNTHGTVYERVSGRTIPVQEPLRLAELFARGDQARKDAETKADRAGWQVLEAGRALQRYAHQRPRFGLGLAAAGYLPDISSRLFSPAFEELVVSTIDGLDHGPRIAGGPALRPSVTQGSRSFESEGQDRLLGWSWLVRATWDGAIGIFWVPGVDQGDISTIVTSPVRQAWTAADQMLNGLASRGPRYLGLKVAGAMFPGSTAIGHGPVSAGPDDLALGRIERELRRATGEMAYEPNPPE
jgi:hypothetical protein